MNAFFLWLESSSWSIWIRESTSVWAYPAILSAHAIGMALAAGINAALALRLLGVAPGVPIGEMRRFVPLMWAGFWMNAVSGVALLVAYPTKALTNPLFYVKMSLIAVAMGIFIVLSRRLFRPLSVDTGARMPMLTLVGAASLTCWAGAIVAGRLLAYTYTRLFATW